jgi:signal peptidase II
MLNFFNRRIKNTSAYLAGAVFLFLLDRWLKNWALAELYNQKIDIIKKIFSLELFKNENIAFSFYLPQTVIFSTVVAVIAVLLFVLVWRLIKRRGKAGAPDAGMFLIILGALSNLADRLHFGFVIDYFNFVYWPVFNVADIMITGGVLVLALGIWKNKS